MGNRQSPFFSFQSKEVAEVEASCGSGEGEVDGMVGVVAYGKISLFPYKEEAEVEEASCGNDDRGGEEDKGNHRNLSISSFRSKGAVVSCGGDGSGDQSAFFWNKQTRMDSTFSP